jgi:hypothetical protein
LPLDQALSVGAAVSVTPDAVTFTLDIRTVSITNSREHWRAKARRAADERLSVVAAWINACARRLEPHEVAGIHMKRLGPRKLDSDNLQGALKSVRDGIAACLGLDDGSPRLVWMYEQGKGKPGQYAVEVEVMYGSAKGTMLEAVCARESARPRQAEGERRE